MYSFEDIAIRVPVNKEAAFALIPSEGVVLRYGHRVRSATPFPITTVPLPKVDKWGTPLENLTGQVFGRLTVVGRLHDLNWENGKKIQWVVKCTCGYYETRRNGSIRKLTTEQSMCSQCEALERRKFISAHGSYDERRERAGKYHPRHENKSNQLIPTILIEAQPDTPRFYTKTPIPPEIRWRVWERDNFTCLHCKSRKHLSVDHIIAESKGGLMVLDNLQTLCRRCNSKKGAR